MQNYGDDYETERKDVADTQEEINDDQDREGF